ncbi:MAG: low temperature requirement protein A [Actinomycetes bacterium]
MGPHELGVEPPAAGVHGVPGETSLELFYDLVYAAGIVVLSQSFSNSPSVWTAVWVFLVFSMMWALWLRTNLLLHDRGATNNVTRGLLVLQMTLILVMCVAGGDKLLDQSTMDRHHLVGPLFALSLLTLVALYRFSTTREGVVEPPGRRRVTGYLLIALCFAVTPLFPARFDLLVAGVGLVLLLVPSRVLDGPGSPGRFEAEHVVERFGEFTIIVLGETFVKVGLTALKGGISGIDIVVLPVAIVLVFATWWLYFADVPTAAVASVERSARPWVMAHFPLHLSAVALAIGCAELMLEGGRDGVHVLQTFAVPLIGVVLSLALLAWISGAPHRRRVLAVHGVGAAVLLGVAVVGSAETAVSLDLTCIAMAAVMVGIVVASRPTRTPVLVP